MYRALSFSWTSVDEAVGYDRRACKHDKYETALLCCQCGLKELNPFGEVTGGFILVEGPTIPLILSCGNPKDF